MKQNKIPRNEYIRKPVGKTNPYKHDVLYTDMGQWKYPGEVTKIPSGDITMQGVSYPVYGEDNLGNSQMMYPGMDYNFPGQYVTEYPMAIYGGDPSLTNITGHYPFGGQNSKTGTHFEEGGWLDDYDEYKRGGQRKRKYGTSKNIASSINDIMRRNEVLYGPAGRQYYNPNSKYQEGGWLDQYQEAGQLRAASTPVASAVSTLAPKVKTNPTGWEFVKHAWANREPSDWNLMMMDKSGAYVDSGVDPFTLMLSAPQQVLKTASALKAVKSGTPKNLKVSQVPQKLYKDLDIKDKVIYPQKTISTIPEELEPYISRKNPDFYKLYDKNLSQEEMAKKLFENTIFYDRKGNIIPAPESFKKAGGQKGWLDKYNNF